MTVDEFGKSDRVLRKTHLQHDGTEGSLSTIEQPDERIVVASQVVAVEVVDPTKPPEVHAIPMPPEQYQQGGTTTATSTSNDQNQYYHMEDDVGDDGFDCMLCGDAKVKTVRPGCNFFMSLCGNTFIDIRHSNPPLPPCTKVNVLIVRLCGDVRLLVPPGTRVRVRRFLLCGNRDIDLGHHDPNTTVAGPKINMTVVSLCGDVRVRSCDCEAAAATTTTTTMNHQHQEGCCAEC